VSSDPRDDFPKQMTGSVTGSILILAFCNLCSFADRQLTAIMAGPIKAHFSLDHSAMALLGGTAFAIMYGFAGIPAGLAADKFSRRRMIAGAVLFWSACTAICGWTNSFGVLFAARIGVGIGEAILLPCAFSLIHDVDPPHRRGFAFALFGLGIPAGMALGSAAGGMLNDVFAVHTAHFGLFGPLEPWQKTFNVLALLGVPAGVSRASVEGATSADANIAGGCR
jgi:MFS family permease